MPNIQFFKRFLNTKHTPFHYQKWKENHIRYIKIQGTSGDAKLFLKCVKYINLYNLQDT